MFGDWPPFSLELELPLGVGGLDNPLPFVDVGVVADVVVLIGGVVFEMFGVDVVVVKGVVVDVVV